MAQKPKKLLDQVALSQVRDQRPIQSRRGVERHHDGRGPQPVAWLFPASAAAGVGRYTIANFLDNTQL